MNWTGPTGRRRVRLPRTALTDVNKPLSAGSSRNAVLARLSRSDLLLIAPHLEPVELALRQQLSSRRKRIEDIYFIETGLASVVAEGSGKQIEIGLIGWDGMTGLDLVMGSTQAPHDTFMQVPGKALRISAARLRDADAQSDTLHRCMLIYAHAFLLQTAQTALANGRARLEARLSRWLLMAHDRLDDDDVPLTHEFLALMLGTPRPGVTIALNGLERAGLITTRRGNITILDRKSLLKAADGTYVPPAF